MPLHDNYEAYIEGKEVMRHVYASDIDEYSVLKHVGAQFNPIKKQIDFVVRQSSLDSSWRLVWNHNVVKDFFEADGGVTETVYSLIEGTKNALLKFIEDNNLEYSPVSDMEGISDGDQKGKLD